MTLPIEKMLVLSTSHIDKETACLLNWYPVGPPKGSADAVWWPSWTRREGWLFYVPEKAVGDERYKAAPACLQACINLAREADCGWLMLDADGEKVDGLPTWEW